MRLGTTAEPAKPVSLGSKRDRLGMREVVVDWQLVPEDKTQGRRNPSPARDRDRTRRIWPVASLVDRAMMPGRTDFTVTSTIWGRRACTVIRQLGVVDENCRVHIVANLYVAGSSVFPTGSANNPTLTIVALALRLADHLKRQLA